MTVQASIFDEIRNIVHKDDDLTAIKSGVVGQIADYYSTKLSPGEGKNGDRLLGFLINLNYDEVTIVTCDPWKRKCGGVPRNSLVLIKVSPDQVNREDSAACNRLIMARITDSVPTPVANDTIATIFQIHKHQATIDPITQKELQWSALKGSVVGTFYDNGEETSSEIKFGLDIDTYYAPHAYEVYVPVASHLESLINCFSDHPTPIEIGVMRFTETPSISNQDRVPIKVDPTDFIGKTYGHRTALFGKTRYGKSNTMKVVADTALYLKKTPGQIIFDPSGEYTYWNEQDNGSLYARHTGKCIRYALQPRVIEQEELKGFSPPETLKIDFFGFPDVGFRMISQMWLSEYASTPDYLGPLFNWEPEPINYCPPKTEDQSGYSHFWRTMALWYTILLEAGFAPKNENKAVYIGLKKTVKVALAEIEDVGGNALVKVKTDSKGNSVLEDFQSLRALPIIFSKLKQLWDEKKGVKDWFGTSDGKPYFDKVEEAMLNILDQNFAYSGTKKFTRFTKYHSKYGAAVFIDIVTHALDGKTVLLDLAMGDLDVRKTMSEMVARELLNRMMMLFTRGELKDKFVVLYFEEAHNLFPRDDKGLGENVYNKIAKEGAKFNISMVYATQSMSTLSPDLLKNTENFIVTHLDDDREVKELKHKRAFRDIAADVERIQSKGYVQIKTLSMPLALPVQIRKFDGQPVSEAN
jgi:hypothetical protein